MMTISQVEKAAKEYDYILLNTPDCRIAAVNCKVILLAMKKKKYNKSRITIFESYKDISFHEYISKKHSIV